MLYTAQPTPIGTAQPAVYSPVPAPAPSYTDWGNLWNVAWNTGYNQANSTSNPYSGQSGGGYDIGAGFSAGQQQYYKDHPTPQPQTSGSNQVLSTSTQSQSTAPSFPTISQDELNSIYAPAMENLNQQESYLRSSQPTYEAQVKTEAQLAVDKLNAQKQQGYSNFGLQRNDLEQQKQSAWTEARNLYNELSQRGISRFGGGNSTGKAYSEILGRETQKSLTSANSILGRGLAQITQAQNKLDSDVQIGLQEIDFRKEQGLQAIKDKFSQDIMSINNNRAMIESAKAQARIEALREARIASYNWNEAQAQYAQALKLYSVQQQTGLNNSINDLIKNLPEDVINSFNNEMADTVDDQAYNMGTKANSTFRPASTINLAGIWDKKEEDPFVSMNPFA